MKREYDFSKARRNPYVKPQPWTWGETLLYAIVAAAFGCAWGFMMWLAVKFS